MALQPLFSSPLLPLYDYPATAPTQPTPTENKSEAVQSQQDLFHPKRLLYESPACMEANGITY